MKFFAKKFMAAFLFLFFAHNAKASHLLGGHIFYEYLSDSTYRINLVVYRDCYDQTQFDGDSGSLQQFAFVGVFESASGNIVDTMKLYNPVVTNYHILSDTGCWFDYCIAKAIYTQTITLPSSAIGYTIAYQRCCLNAAIANISASTGITFSASIPPAGSLYNNRTVINGFPVVFNYVNDSLFYDVLATDADADSLQFSLCLPYEGASSWDPAPVPSGPPYNNMQWATPYSIANVMGGTPLTIDSFTGVITGVPNTIGRFMIGVCVKEFRNQHLINSAIFPLPFIIRACITSNSDVLSSPNFSLSPNPATSLLTIETETSSPFDISLFDITGKCIRTIKSNTGNHTTIHVEDLSAGYYFLKIADNNFTTTKRFVIAR